MTAPQKPMEPWNTEFAAELAAEALGYLVRHYPECAASEVLRGHEEAAHEAAMDADEVSTGRRSGATARPVETRPCVYDGARRELGEGTLPALARDGVGTPRGHVPRGATDGGGPRGVACCGRIIGSLGGARVRAGGVAVAGNPVKHPRFRGAA